MTMIWDGTNWYSVTTGMSASATQPAICRSCGFADCPNAGNALDWCPRWHGEGGIS